MFCRTCGTQVLPDANFCLSCGYRIERQPEPVIHPQGTWQPHANAGSRFTPFYELRQRAWNQCRGNYFMLFCTALLWNFVFAIPMIVLMFVSVVVPGLNLNEWLILVILWGAMLLFVIIIFPFTAIMRFGQIENESRMYNGKSAEIESGFIGFKKPSAPIKLELLSYLYIILWAFVFIIPS